MVDRDGLSRAYDAQRALPFPESADDALAGWIADLAEVDGYYAGLATTVLGHGRVDRVMPHAEELAAALDRIETSTPEDQDTLVACRDYVRVLKRVDEALRQIST